MPALRNSQSGMLRPRTVPVKCELCAQVINRKADMPRHLRSHDPSFKIPCPFEGCEFSAHQKSNLETHMRRHIGARIFGCNECLFTTCDSACLLRHRKNIHGYIPRPVAPRNNIPREPKPKGQRTRRAVVTPQTAPVISQYPHSTSESLPSLSTRNGPINTPSDLFSLSTSESMPSTPEDFNASTWTTSASPYLFIDNAQLGHCDPYVMHQDPPLFHNQDWLSQLIPDHHRNAYPGYLATGFDEYNLCQESIPSSSISSLDFPTYDSPASSSSMNGPLIPYLSPFQTSCAIDGEMPRTESAYPPSDTLDKVMGVDVFQYQPAFKEPVTLLESNLYNWEELLPMTSSDCSSGIFNNESNTSLDFNVLNLNPDAATSEMFPLIALIPSSESEDVW